MLEDYLAACKDACDGEINRLYGSGQRGSSGLYDLILDYPLRGGKALRPALSIATCLGLGGHLEAVLPTAATLELYHNAFLIHDDIEDESWWRRGRPTLHIDHGIPIAVNVGDAMLSLSLQPLLDNVERVGLGPALRILRAVAHMTRQTVEGQALELDWVRSNTWQLDDADYLAMVELKTSWYSFITPLQVGAVAAGAGPEQLAPLESLGRHLGAAFQITDDLLNLRADPEEYGKEIGGDLWEGKRTLMLLHALRCAEPEDRDRAVQILAKRRPSADGELRLDRAAGPAHRPRASCPGPGGPRSRLALQGHRTSESKNLDDIRWLYGLMHRVGSLDHAREVAGRHAGRRPPCWPLSTGCRPASTGTCWAASSTTCTGAPDEPRSPASACWPSWSGSGNSPSTSSSAAPRGCSRPLRTRPPGPSGPCTSCFSAPAARCSATPRPPAGLHDLLVAEGRRYADTPAGAQLRDALVASEAVENLRRVWETVSLNVLDGPAPPNAAPDAWAELLADAIIGHGLDDSILARLRPEGFA